MLSKDTLDISSEKISINIVAQESEIKAIEICQLLRRLKNNDLMELDENIAQAADMINQLTRDHTANVVSDIVIAQAKDASLSVEILNDDMKAAITVNAPWGGKSVRKSDLTHFIKMQGITNGILEQQFDDHIKAAEKLKPGQTYQFDAAIGQPATNGNNCEFKILVGTMEDRELKPQQRANGKVDMHDLGEVTTVAVNTPLIERIPPTEGKAGYTIFGKALAPTPGESFEFTVNDGTQISPDNNNLLVSAIEGVPRLYQGSIAINDTLKVKNVDIGFGNIDYKGNVVVQGDVCEGMTVKSQGDITIGGCINSATLIAGGNIIVEQGIFGKKRRADESLTCHVEAQGSINAQYMQYANISAGVNVEAQTQVLHCHVTAGDSVKAANKAATKGTIFGGNITAKNKVSCVELGGNAGSKTELTLTAELCDVREQLDAHQDSLNKEFAVLQQLISAHDKVKGIDSKQEKKQLLGKLKRNIDKKVAIIVSLKKAMATLNEQIAQARESMSIVAKKTLYDGVKITMDNCESQTLEQYHAIKITLSNGTIAIGSLKEE
ncbi:MAG: FapA family protein [Psychrobium sp.]